MNISVSHPVGNAMTLLEQLDAARGQDPWNGGPRITLRALFTNTGMYNHEAPRWHWYRDRTTAFLRCERTGAWDANNLDHEAACSWEMARREAGVSNEEVAKWLGVAS